MVTSVAVPIRYEDDGYQQSGMSPGLIRGNDKVTSLIAGDTYVARMEVPVYPGSTINSATISLTGYKKTASEAGSTTFDIWLDRAANSAALTEGVDEYTIRTKTTAKVTSTFTWNTAGTSTQAMTSANIKPLLDEVMALGWTRGNYVTIFMRVTAKTGTSNEWYFYDKDNTNAITTEYAAKLNIDWTPPVGVTTGPPAVTLLPIPPGNTGQQVNLDWTYTDPDGDTQRESRYRHRIPASTTAWTDVVRVQHSTPQRQFSPNSTGTYEIQVAIADAGGWSDWSNIQTLVVNGPPTAPTNLVVQDGVVGGKAQATWTFNDPEGQAQEQYYFRVREYIV